MIYTQEQIAAQGQKRSLLAVCESGKRYNATYDPDYNCMFFAIPGNETIIGYEIVEEK